jgi:hypothetical protein
VNTSGECTTHADCCTGLPCVIPTGQTKGICGGTLTPDGGVTPGDGGAVPGDGGGASPDGAPICALYGQSCGPSTPCCDNVPCNLGSCVIR